jgi:hypothetical protein
VSNGEGSGEVYQQFFFKSDSFWNEKRKLKRRLIYECRCDESLKAKTSGSTLVKDVNRRKKKQPSVCEECRSLIFIF